MVITAGMQTHRSKLLLLLLECEWEEDGVENWQAAENKGVDAAKKVWITEICVHSFKNDVTVKL